MMTQYVLGAAYAMTDPSPCRERGLRLVTGDGLAQGRFGELRRWVEHRVRCQTAVGGGRRRIALTCRLECGAFLEPAAVLQVGEYCLHSGVRPRLRLEAHLAEDGADVALDRAGLDEQLLGDGGVAEAAGHAVEDFAFAVGEFGQKDALALVLGAREL